MLLWGNTLDRYSRSIGHPRLVAAGTGLGSPLHYIVLTCKSILWILKLLISFRIGIVAAGSSSSVELRGCLRMTLIVETCWSCSSQTVTRLNQSFQLSIISNPKFGFSSGVNLK